MTENPGGEIGGRLLKILHLEDDSDDAALTSAALRKDGVTCEIDVVTNRQDFAESLVWVPYDLILSDYKLPGFDGLAALRIARACAPLVPFILLSGRIGEEGAVAAIRAGVTDYVSKDSLSRLSSAVQRALTEAEDRIKRQNAEESLRKSETRYRQLVERTQVVPWELDPKSMQFTYAGPQAFNLLGYPLADWYESGFWPSRIHPADRDEVVRFRQYETHLGKDHEVEYRMMAADGRDVWVRDLVTVDKGVGGRLILRGLLLDITERKHADEAMLHARDQALEVARLRSEFLDNVGHELRTPLTGILTTAALMLETDLGKDQKEFLESARSSAEDLLRVLNNMLDLSDIERGKLELADRPFNFPRELSEAIAPLTHLADRKGLELVCHIAPGTPNDLVGDAAKMRQALVNVVGNAIKFTDRGRVEVRVSAELGEEQRTVLHFEVMDTGVGISADRQPFIFQPFAQADGSHTRRFGGAGLGLSIASRIVELMGGRIWMESMPGVGSTFFFTVPFDSSRAEIT